MEAQSSFFRADDHWPFTGTDCTVRYSQYLRSRSTCFSSSLRRSHRTQQRTLGPCCWDYRKEYESQQGQEWPTGNFSKGEEDSILLPSQRRPLLQQPSAFECQLRSRHNTWLPAIFNHAKQKHRLHSLLVADQARFVVQTFCNDNDNDNDDVGWNGRKPRYPSFPPSPIIPHKGALVIVCCHLQSIWLTATTLSIAHYAHIQESPDSCGFLPHDVLLSHTNTYLRSITLQQWRRFTAAFKE